MRINEVIDHERHMFDILSFPEIVEIDKDIDALFDITQEFYVPAKCLNDDRRIELFALFNAYQLKLKTIFPESSEWRVKIARIVKYLGD